MPFNAPPSREDLATFAKNSLYVTVGVGVVGVQQLDALRREIAIRLSTQVGTGREQVDQLVGTVEAQIRNLDERVKALELDLAKALDTVQEKLPEPAGDVFAKARKATADARKAATEAGERIGGFVRDVAA
jgi:uncharacterized protein (DUF885 family)